jgi:endonuclease YncB( thermonuclease family)
VKKWKLFVWLCGGLLLGLITAAKSVQKDGPTVTLNGESVRVQFIDGDTFRLLEGNSRPSLARILGYNTLETYGPVHSWGNWAFKDLLNFAYAAAREARAGNWHCEATEERDQYERLLVECPDLAEFLLERGLAHAMTISDEPAKKAYLAVQKRAQKAHVGIWARGVPTFILTSTHSEAESENGERVYDRFISTYDGHSIPWFHRNRYETCERVCYRPLHLNKNEVPLAFELLRKDETIREMVQGKNDAELLSSLGVFTLLGERASTVQDEMDFAMVQRVLDYKKKGLLPLEDPSDLSCMRYVPFESRYGNMRPDCLR